MAKIVECVPNFSEGRRPEVIGEIIREIEAVQGITLLDSEMDKDHNRAVVTFVGEPEVVEEAAFQAIKKASELINLEEHQGEHPRMGATDVCPFIPVSGVTMKTCVAMAKRLGERVGNELEIPVYLYVRTWQLSVKESTKQSVMKSLPTRFANPISGHSKLIRVQEPWLSEPGNFWLPITYI